MTSTMTLRCPKCAGEMATYERSGIVVDQCRECRGIFLDRGELEKLVDAEGGAWVGPQPGVPAQATHAAPVPVAPAGYAPMPPGRGPQPQHARYDDRGRDGYRQEWDDDDDRDDRQAFDPRGSNGSNGRPPRKRSFLGDILEGFGE
jgi:Zn-finger nucleic acid-binding protein